jgi:hypothetical protein
MSAQIILFPQNLGNMRKAPSFMPKIQNRGTTSTSDIRILPDAGCWLVLANAHAWIHGNAKAARDDAQWLSQNLGLPIREIVAATGRAARRI